MKFERAPHAAVRAGGGDDAVSGQHRASSMPIADGVSHIARSVMQLRDTQYAISNMRYAICDHIAINTIAASAATTPTHCTGVRRSFRINHASQTVEAG